MLVDFAERSAGGWQLVEPAVEAHGAADANDGPPKTGAIAPDENRAQKIAQWVMLHGLGHQTESNRRKQRAPHPGQYAAGGTAGEESRPTAQWYINSRVAGKHRQFSVPKQAAYLVNESSQFN
jgi:hypothetical protein